MVHIIPPCSHHQHFKHLSYHGTKAYILTKQKLLSRVCCRRWQLASCWHLQQSPTSCCLRCPKRWKSQGARLGLYGGWSIISQPQHSNQSQSQVIVLYGAHWHLFGPLKHLAGKRFATDTMKLSPPGYTHVALTSMPWYKPLCLGETIAEKSVATVKVWCLPSGTHVPSVHSSHNKVLLTRVFIRELIFCKFLVTWPTHLEWLVQKHPIKKKTKLNEYTMSVINHQAWHILIYQL